MSPSLCRPVLKIQGDSHSVIVDHWLRLQGTTTASQRWWKAAKYEAASGCVNICTDTRWTATLRGHTCLCWNLCFMSLDVGVVSYGLCSAQSQSDAGPLWVSSLLPCHPVLCSLHPVLPLHQVIHTPMLWATTLLSITAFWILHTY